MAHVEWIVQQKGDGMRVRPYLQEIKGMTRRVYKALQLEGGLIEINGEVPSVRYHLHVGDRIRIVFPPEKIADRMVPEAIPLNIVYEDNAVLVVNKPANMATMPSVHHPYGTLANAVLGHYKCHNIRSTVHIVTRLDRDTTGLVLIAKQRYSHSLLSKAQLEDQIGRRYQAVVEGDLPDESGTIDKPIGRKPGSIIERIVTDTGKNACTEYQVLNKQDGRCLVDVLLHTGRTHQIRVHFSYFGYPLLGDDLYGKPTDAISRQALHCNQLQFPHPFTGERMTFISDLPKDMQHLIE